MNLLIDTHVLIWFLNGDEKTISPSVRKLIESPENQCFVSIASLWEMAIKIRLGTLQFTPGFKELPFLLEKNGFQLLPVEISHLQQLLELPCSTATRLTGS